MSTSTEPSVHGAPGDVRRISEFRPEDAAAVADMFNGSNADWPGGFTGGVPWTAEKVLEMQNDRRPLATFIAWEGSAAAGYCSLYEYPGEQGEAGYVGLLNAATRFHGRGHGRDLLKAALQRCLELGYRRVDLHTWPGNMKAVPLYKKSGYFWVPDSSVHMENYLPLLLRLPILADFWAEADWYRTQVRDLSVQEDLFLDGGMRVYLYEFRHGHRFVKATIDATARGLTALETERWRIACQVDDRRLIGGRPATVRWEVENRGDTPLAVTIIATGGTGLDLKKEETVTVVDRYSAEAVLTADAGAKPPPPGKPAPHIASLLVLDGQPVRLETGVEIKPACEVRLVPRRLRLIPGQWREVVLQLQSHLDEDATVTLHLIPSVEVSFLTDADREVTVDVPADSFGGATVRLRATAMGIHTLEVRPVVRAGGTVLAMDPIHLPLPAAGPGDIVAFQADAPTGFHPERATSQREWRVETAGHRLVVQLRAGNFALEDAATGASLGGGRLLAGPPFNWSAQSLVEHEATIEQQGGAVTVRLRGAVPHLPAAIIEHELAMMAGGLLRFATAITNSGAEPLDAQAATEAWAGGHLDTIVLPTVDGLILTSMPEFPDWGDLALQRPAQFREGWVARQGEGRVCGLLWSEATRIEVGAWALAELRQGGTLAPGERRRAAPVYLYSGPGNWQTVRALWRSLIAPDAPERAPLPREVLTLTGSAAPAAVLVDSPNRLALSSAMNREVAGALHWETPAGWSLEPEPVVIAGLRVGQTQHVSLRARHLTAGPGAAQLRGVLRTDFLEQRVFDGAILDIGRHAGGVAVTEERREGQPVWAIANGFLRITVAPQFAAGIVAVETLADGVNHLHSAFPTARSFGWMRPWFGGVHPALYNQGPGHFPDPGRLYDERYTAAPASASGLDGRTWHGVAVSSVLTGRGLRGLTLRVAYLTLPGSNLVALEVTVGNRTGATLPVDAALIAYLQPAGTLSGVELLTRAGERRLLREQRTIGVGSGDWIGVRNPVAGRTVAVVCGAADGDSHTEGLDWGLLGAHAALRCHFVLPASGEKKALAYLVIAADEAEAAAYRSLAGAALL